MIRKLTNNIFRITLTDEYFGQIIRDGKKWNAEIRKTETGTLVRFAGIWNSRKDAIEELESIRL